MRSTSFIAISIALLATASSAQVSAPVTPMTPDSATPLNPVREEAEFVRSEAMVPMRDGTKLYTTWVTKKGIAPNAPILLTRTPYNAYGSVHRESSQRLHDILAVMDWDYVDDGYIRVYQDIRGLNRSDGDFVMNRPISGPLNPTGIDEATDAYDTIDWLVKNLPGNNGRVGVVGSSYPGFTALVAEINPHPALKAAVPQSPMVDGWMGDDWFHNGAFRVSGIDFGVAAGTNKFAGGGDLAVGQGEDYDRYLEAGAIGHYARKLGVAHYPWVRKLTENPAYTEFWSGQAVDKWFANQPLKVPTLLMLGQWDQEDSYGAPAAYRALEPKDVNNDMVHFAIGPWRHSGVNHYGYELGALTFTGDTADYFRKTVMKPFFDYHLKGGPNPNTPPVITYATGIDQWQRTDRWPVGTQTPLYLRDNFSVSFDRPSAAGKDSYVSDPANPVPFIPRPIDMDASDQWKGWLVHDQRFVTGRTDVLTYKGEVLDKPVHIMGAPEADIYLSTSGSDADIVVKLIDVYPNDIPEGANQGSKPSMAGYQLPIGIEIFRGRYVKSFARPEPLKPGRFERFRFALPNVNHVVLPGHRLMVQIQSTLFPLYDRNPQKYVQNIFFANPGDYQKATITIGRGGATPSAVNLPIAPN